MEPNIGLFKETPMRFRIVENALGDEYRVEIEKPDTLEWIPISFWYSNFGEAELKVQEVMSEVERVDARQQTSVVMVYGEE